VGKHEMHTAAAATAAESDGATMRGGAVVIATYAAALGWWAGSNYYVDGLWRSIPLLAEDKLYGMQQEYFQRQDALLLWLVAAMLLTACVLWKHGAPAGTTDRVQAAPPQTQPVHEANTAA
jgi:hypothetical protein